MDECMPSDALANAASQLNDADVTTQTDDIDRAPVLQGYPMTVLDIGDVENVRLAGSLDGENVLTSESNSDFPTDVVVTVTNPEVQSGTLFMSDDGFGTNEGQYKDFMLLDMEQGFAEYDYNANGDVAGVSYYGNSWSGSETTFAEEGIDRIEIRAGKRVGMRLARVFDANGLPLAGQTDDEGNDQRGLVERPPEDSEAVSRIAREPVTRDTSEYDTLSVFYYFAEGGQNGNRPHNVDVFEGDIVDATGDLQQDNLLNPTVNPEAIPEDVYSSMAYGGTDTAGDDTGPFGDDDEDDANNPFASDAPDGYSDLPEQDQSFVDGAVGFLHENGVTTIDAVFDDWAQTYEQQEGTQDGHTGAVSAGKMQSIIEQRV